MLKEKRWTLNMILLLDSYDYTEWFKEKDEGSANITSMPPLEDDDEEVKDGKRIKIFTPNKLLTRVPVLLAQTKAWNNSYKLKNKIRQILYLLYLHNKITKTIDNNLIK